ncbi:MAG: hypothetical protein GY868_15920, partial [Deltaproteobacteria bacterium]|nr:hypothetical protein [Deltaproteobacteria bacterium]
MVNTPPTNRDQLEREVQELRLKAAELDRTKQSLEQVQQRLRMNEMRFDALALLNTMTRSTTDEIITFTLEKGVKLTESSIGYLHF